MVLFFCFSYPHTASQNRKYECKICIINNMIHTILVHSCSSLLLASCTSMDTYLLKILPRMNMSNHFPTQVMYHRDPSYTHLCVFGCLFYPFFPSITIKKLQLCLTPCVFLGYTLNHIGYKCFNLSQKYHYFAPCNFL